MLSKTINEIAATKSWSDLDRRVSENLPPNPSTGRTIEFREVELSLKVLDNIACLVNEGYAPYKLIVERLLKNEFLRWWDTFGPYIQHRREIKKGPSMPGIRETWLKMEYCHHLQTLVAKIEGTNRNKIKPVETAPIFAPA